MGHLIGQSEFARRLTALTPSPTERLLRQLIFQYCKRTQDIYWFDQLENAFAYLDIVFGNDDHDPADWAEDLAAVKVEVEEAMGEYFISLNEVATAMARLLDERDMTVEEALEALEHVWAAHACHESPEDFIPREDDVLCGLLTSAQAEHETQAFL